MLKNELKYPVAPFLISMHTDVHDFLYLHAQTCIIHGSFNDNTMRGETKLLAPLPTGKATWETNLAVIS